MCADMSTQAENDKATSSCAVRGAGMTFAKGVNYMGQTPGGQNVGSATQHSQEYLHAYSITMIIVVWISSLVL